MANPGLPVLIEVSEYRGEKTIAVACTQLGTSFTATRARRVVDEWVDFFASPSELVSLQFTTRTPKRLFAALAGQRQLESLTVKWGDYGDLAPIAGMTELRHLALRGASAMEDVSPLASLTRLATLALEGFRRIPDTSPLGNLTSLTNLELGGNWMSDRVGHIDSVSFLTRLARLQNLLLHTVIVDDLDYTPLLHLPAIRSVRVMQVRGMQPGHEELKRRLPWSS